MNRIILQRKIEALILAKGNGLGGFSSVAGAGSRGGGISTVAMVNRTANMMQSIAPAAAMVANSVTQSSTSTNLFEKLGMRKADNKLAEAEANRLLIESEARAQLAQTESEAAQAVLAANAKKAQIATQDAEFSLQLRMQEAADKRALAEAEQARKQSNRDLKEARRLAADTQRIKDATEAATKAATAGTLTPTMSAPVAAAVITQQQMAAQGVAMNSPAAQQVVYDVASEAVAKAPALQTAGVSLPSWAPLAIIATLGAYFLFGRKGER